MMNNLFVCHTQYDLVMSISIINQYYQSESNDLILFLDFNINDNMKSVLERSFTNTLFLSGEITTNDTKYIRKACTLQKSYKHMKEYLSDSYDNLFWKCDYSWMEIWLNKELHKINDKVVVHWLEDGAYFAMENRIVNIKNNRIKFLLRACIGRILFGKYYSFNGTGIGTSTWNNVYCLTFPNAVRDKYKGKPYLSISESSFSYAMKYLYQYCDFKIEDGSLLLFIDKIDRYKKLDSVLQQMKLLLQECENRNVKLYYKYHPRENARIEQLSLKGIEIEKSIGAEGLYSSNIGRRIKIVGIASTSLLTASKCGFDVFSMAEITGESN